MVKCTLLTREQFQQAEEDRTALAKSRGQDANWLREKNSTYGYASLSEIIPPGSMWHVPWYYDPENDRDGIRAKALEKIRTDKFDYPYYLSKFYWIDWSDKRPPICVLTPNGKEWCIDAKSSNGDGWQVTGEAPLLSVTPSIRVPGYHGWLGVNGAPIGEFSAPLADSGAA